MNIAKNWVVFAAFCASITAGASSSFRPVASEARSPGESYLTAHAAAQSASGFQKADGETPWSQQRPLDQLDPGNVPAVGSLSELQWMFEGIRDLRGWKWSGMPDFARRIPWLFASDGCYLRAELIVEKFREWHIAVPKQVMAFGDLTGTTEYETVGWWYHVAPILRVGGASYVLDPSLDAHHPLELRAWLSKMASDPNATKVSICNADAVDPEGECYATQSNWDEGYKASQLELYLGEEWNLLRNYLNAEPTDLLGDHPPWHTRH
jgi:hypothetical protein